MKKIKVRVYPKSSEGQGSYVNKTAKFLQKAAYGTEVKNVLVEIDDFILEELLSNQNPDSIASKVQTKYGLDYYRALDRIEDMKGVYESNTDKAKEEEKVEFIPDANPYLEDENETNFGNRSNYPTMSEESMALDEEAFPWDSEAGVNLDYEAAGNEILGNQMPMVDSYTVTDKKQGGAMPKHKFVKKVVQGLKKAAEGTEQQDTEANEATTNDIPVGGRGKRRGDFFRAMKDAGNKYYANQIYDQSKQLEQQQFGAAEGMQIEQPETDIENPAHHLLAFSQAMGDTFKQPMNDNQRIGSSDPEIPEAKYGRRMARQAARQWDRMFGNVPIGMFGQGVPNYLGYIMPGQGMGMPQVDPRQMYLSGMDVRYTKRPFRKTMEINNIPFFMPNAAMEARQIPYTYPGEIIYRDAVTEEKKVFGGPIMDPQPNEYGQLQRFVGGGDEMPTPAYSAYAENDIDTKDVEDPYYKDGGLHKYQGTGNSEKQSLTAEEIELAKKYGINDPGFSVAGTREQIRNHQRNEWIDNQMSSGQQNNTFKPLTSQAELDAYLANNQRQQYYNQGYMPQMGNMGYNPWASGSYNPWGDIGKVLGSLGRKNKSYWLSQSGPVTKDGQTYQPKDAKTIGNEYANYVDFYNNDFGQPMKEGMVRAPRQSYDEWYSENYAGLDEKGMPKMETDPTKAGYRPNLKYDERGLFGNKKSGSLTWNWYDPANNPVAQGTNQPNPNNNTPTLRTDLNPRQQKKEEKFTELFARQAATNPKGNIKPFLFNKAATSNQITPTNQPPTQAYGGVPHFQGLDESQVQFDPNVNQQAVDPNYHPSFTTNFDVHPTRQNFQGINAGKNLLAYGIIEGSDALNNAYQDSYLGANTTSDNRAPANQLVTTGLRSGLNERIMIDPRSNPGFTGVRAKTGGTMKYKKDDVYDLTQEEIGAILAAGGQIKFI
jgi:hypothetical protein